MAEIATNVLHNVGNVLNSVNVSASLVSNRVRNSKVIGLSKVVKLMNEHTDDLGDFLTKDQKGKMLPDYLAKLAETVSTEQLNIIEELTKLTKSVDHVKEIVATQQSYAGPSSVLDRCQVNELIDDAISMHTDSLSNHRVAVVKEFAKLPAMQLDRHRVLQIMINLISNAKNAMRGVTGREYQIILRLGQSKENTIQIQVADNGEGIPPENLSRIFAHGFTTRKEGHGFGLHSCVLAAREMGGSLTVHSDGIGQGATFTLELPVHVDVEEALPQIS
jgi:signal transduction histidine kinase